VDFRKLNYKIKCYCHIRCQLRK